MAHDLEDPLTSKWTCRDLPARQGQGTDTHHPVIQDIHFGSSEKTLLVL